MMRLNRELLGMFLFLVSLLSGSQNAVEKRWRPCFKIFPLKAIHNRCPLILGIDNAGLPQHTEVMRQR